MESLGLGEVEDFGFLDPPDRRQIRDGKALLHELGALDLDAEDPRKRLTKLGRRLAQLPVDPRIGRMVLEADRAGCADEVVVIAAALSIQDPRIRPAEKRAEADEQHARFVDPDERSDFLAYLNLWRHLRARQKELSRNGFRKMCHAEYLHYMRVREWQDLAGQLRQAARNVGVTINEQPAAPDDVHRALLAGPAVARRPAQRRQPRVRRRARRALHALTGLGAGPQAARLGDGRRARRDRAAVRPHGGADPAALDRAAGRAPAQAHVLRAALGAQARVGDGDRARDAVRRAGRRRPQGAVRADRPRAVARAVHPPRAAGGRLDRQPPLPAGQPRPARGGRGARAPRAPARHRRHRRRALRLLRRAHPRERRLRRALRPLVEGRAQARAGAAALHARAAGRRCRDRRGRASPTSGARASSSWR